MPKATEGMVLGDRYELTRQIGRGGMGAVWEAIDSRLGRPVAVKLMTVPGSVSEKARLRFEQEARTIAQLNSPYVVQVFDHGFEAVGPYLVQELLDGEDLARRIQHQGPIVPHEIERLLRQIAKGLGAAHEVGIVHRDLKPANIFLANLKGEDLPTVKLLDFGIAKAVGEDLTGSNDLLGTLNYMSPEQTRGAKNVDSRSDLWSVAVIVFEMLTGRRLFLGSNPVGLIEAIRDGAIAKPGDVIPALTGFYDGFFARALNRDPKYRHSEIRELAAEFSIARATAGAAPATELPSLEPRREPATLTTAKPVSTQPAQVQPATIQSASGRSRRDFAMWAGLAGVAALCVLVLSMGETETPTLPDMEAAGSVSAPRAPASAPRKDRTPIDDRTPLTASEPPATSSSTIEDSYVLMKQALEPKVFGGTATKKEAAKLRAVCAHLEDSACRDKAATVYESMPDD